MKSYGLNILGMSEVRWREFAEVITHDETTFIYSGRPQDDDNKIREGVGILMDKEAKKSLIEWHPVSARIVVARFKTTIRNIADRLCGLVVRVSGYRYRGPGFDPRRYQIF